MAAAVFNKATGASHTAVAAKAGHKIKLYGLVLQAAAAVNVTVEDSGGTDLIGLLALTDTNGLKVVLPSGGMPWAEVGEGLGLNILLSGAVQTGGAVVYEYEFVGG
jgi:hypothetical protein